MSGFQKEIECGSLWIKIKVYSGRNYTTVLLL